MATTTTSTIKYLKVQKAPYAKCGFTNCLYVSTQVYHSFFNTISSKPSKLYLKVTKKDNKRQKEYVFLVRMLEDHDDAVIADEECCFNGLQRRMLGISVNDKLHVTSFSEEKLSIHRWDFDYGQDLYKIDMKVRLFKAITCDISEVELVEHIKKEFSKQVFTMNNVICTDFQGSNLHLTVTRCYFLEGRQSDSEKKSISQPWKEGQQGEFGILSETTDLYIAADEKHTTFKALNWIPRPKRNKLLDPGWKFADMGIGGLDTEFSHIFRRAFASRLFPPQLIQQLGIKHVKGMLLHGPPGTGKTLIARQIGKMLAGKEPKVVNGPEILNKFVGASEEKIRELFIEAEQEYSDKGDQSDLHIIIFDEIDAICKQRGTTGSTGVHDTVVNQLLTKIDGPNVLNNILVIGMTNRKDMLDSALLRPGRLEVHVEIGLPDEDGRQQILKIHTSHMNKNGVLDKDVDINELSKITKNFSGAEIEGLVKAAASYALYGGIDVTKGEIETKAELTDITITMDHFHEALQDVIPAFGVAEDELKKNVQGGIIDWGDEFKQLMKTCNLVRDQLKSSDRTSLMSILLHGANGSGKTALACTLAIKSDFPFIKLISPESMISWSDKAKCEHIKKIFEDSYKSPLSLIVLDCVERLLDYVAIGPRFSNNVLQTLLVLCKKTPQYEGHKLMIIATTSTLRVLEDMDFVQAFKIRKKVPQLSKPEHIKTVLDETCRASNDTARAFTEISKNCIVPIPIKPLQMLIEMAKQDDGTITSTRFQECLHDSGLQTGHDSGLQTSLSMFE